MSFRFITNIKNIPNIFYGLFESSLTSFDFFTIFLPPSIHRANQTFPQSKISRKKHSNLVA